MVYNYGALNVELEIQEQERIGEYNARSTSFEFFFVFYEQQKKWLYRTYCASHILVQLNFRRYYFYFLPDQAQTHLDHFNVLDELCGKISIKSDNG